MNLTDTTTCANSYVVNASNGAANCDYIWSNGTNDSVTTITNSGTYTVTASVNSNCTQSASVNITLLPLPNIQIGNDVVLCDDDSVT